jgi:hypothetical protein
MNKFEKQRMSTQVKGITSKKEIDKLNEFKLILDDANQRYQKNLAEERDGRRACEHEIEKLKRVIEVHGEGRVNKSMQTNLKWVDGETPLKASFW